MQFTRTETVNTKQGGDWESCEHHLSCLENEPILATDAVRVMTDNVNQDEAVLLLGHPLKIAAEREVSSHYKTDYKTDHVAAYLQQEEVKYSSSSSEWLIASVILAVFMVLLVLWLLFLMYKQYWVREAVVKC